MNPHLVKRWEHEIEIILTINCEQQSVKLSTNYRSNIKFAVRLFGRNDITFFKSRLIVSFKVFNWTFTCETWKVVNITYFFPFTDNQECGRNLYKKNMLSVINKKVFKRRKDMIYCWTVYWWLNDWISTCPDEGAFLAIYIEVLHPFCLPSCLGIRRLRAALDYLQLAWIPTSEVVSWSQEEVATAGWGGEKVKKHRCSVMTD